MPDPFDEEADASGRDAPQPASRTASPAATRAALADAILRLTAARGPDKSICPSEAARAVDPQGWRALMPATRAEAAALAKAGRVRALQRGAPVDPARATGPIRLAAPVPDAPR